ncbi:MAG: hypothetical protein C0402_02975 [Thermodesulfovibrio sp.]|nr:hypothetical protein [Thermodesulfovibrio sp.]
MHADFGIDNPPSRNHYMTWNKAVLRGCNGLRGEAVMSGKKLVLIVFSLMLVLASAAYAAPGVEVSGNLHLSGTGTISFPDGKSQTTAATDCTGRYEFNSNVNYPNGDGTVTDCRTGVIWLKNANCTDTSNGIAKAENNGTLAWADANAWVAGLGNGICGLHDGSSAGDWRLPTKTEWMAMVQSARKHGYANPALTDAAGNGQWTEGDIFDSVKGIYWSGSSFDADGAWCVALSIDGGIAVDIKSNSDYVWPVRIGK